MKKLVLIVALIGICSSLFVSQAQAGQGHKKHHKHHAAAHHKHHKS